MSNATPRIGGNAWSCQQSFPIQLRGPVQGEGESGLDLFGGRRSDEFFTAGSWLEPGEALRRPRKTEVRLYLANHELAAPGADLGAHDAIVVGGEKEDFLLVTIPLWSLTAVERRLPFTDRPGETGDKDLAATGFV